ncbi:MAG: hypothetical protein ACI3ZQ_09370 [Candidatus Cryptobacteroides sp.]
MIRKISCIMLTAALAAISCNSGDSIRLTVTGQVINEDIVGNGVEWDPYDEALCWGAQVSDDDWQKLFDRLDFMRPQYVRCMINSPFTYYDANTGKYDRERNSENIIKLLGYCQRNGIMVIFGEYNPPAWTMKSDPEWVEMSMDYLNWLVTGQGFDCIKHFVTFNEPDGSWASTDGDYELWKSMTLRFADEMKKYPELASKVTVAGPDAVLNYHNGASQYDTEGWVAQTAAELDEVTGLYDIHAYPGQDYVRSGRFAEDIAEIRSLVPQGKKIVFGEAGYKYNDPEDAALKAEYDKRVEGHPYTKGSDCNMLVYDRFYALDMPLFLIDIMNGGFSGAAAWMLDDAMHSNGDSGKTEDVKIWGMWNILGEEVFGDALQEEVRPWYWTWSMMCRSFPAGSDIVRIEGSFPAGIRAAAAVTEDGRQSVAFVNFSDKTRTIALDLEKELVNASYIVYRENPENEDNALETVHDNINGRQVSVTLPAGSFGILTEVM